MSRKCVICNEDGKYKCPTCLVYYCSAGCCSKHTETGCQVLAERPKHVEGQFLMRYTTADTVPVEKLRMLRDDQSLNNLLCNPHLRALLTEINSSKEPEKIMQSAMQEPLFVEFADACLKVVKPNTD